MSYFHWIFYRHIYHENIYSLFTVFLKTQKNCVDIICEQPHNSFFCKKLEPVQYKGTLTKTSAIQGTSREKNFLELWFQSLKSRRWFRLFVAA